MSAKRISLGLVGLMAFALAAGCQATPPAASQSGPPQKAVLLTTGNGTTTILLPTSDSKGVERLSSAQSKDAKHCPECEADAIKYFQTGVLSPHCGVCGATRAPMLGTN